MQQIPGYAAQSPLGAMPTDLSLQAPDAPLGRHVVMIESTRWHQSTQGKSDGIVVEAKHPTEGQCGWRINFPRGVKAAKYGPTKAARLAMALSGVALDADPALGAVMYRDMLGATQPARGRWIEIDVRQGNEKADSPGEFYTEVAVIGPASAPTGFESSASPVAPPSAPVAPPPAPAAPPPAPVATFPEEVFDFPAGDARFGSQKYGRSGAVYDAKTGARVG